MAAFLQKIDNDNFISLSSQCVNFLLLRILGEAYLTLKSGQV